MYQEEEAADARAAEAPDGETRFDDVHREDGAGDGADSRAADEAALGREPQDSACDRPYQRAHCSKKISQRIQAESSVGK